jgi:hypothetical protein
MLILIVTFLIPKSCGYYQINNEDNTDFLPLDSQSTLGPLPPPNCDMGKDPSLLTGQTIISGVPSYLWRHGCGPTAAGMVIGYWDGNGYDNLISGSASSQTFLVNQAIASGGNSSNPNPPGSERHYEDYACPEDYYPNMKPDDYITKGRTPHLDNSLADFMNTSKSTSNNYYGWSWFSDVVDSLEGYVKSINPQYEPFAYNLVWGELTWEKYCNEIDAGRPVVLLVDTNGDGSTDHFITAIGYDDSNNYACYNTWDNNVHWYDFSKISGGNAWGIYGATFFAISTGEFNFGLIIGKYKFKMTVENQIIIDCEKNNLHIFGIGQKSNGNFMMYSSDFSKINPDIFLGLPISKFLFGIVFNCKIF